jgi:hypothetical protein
MRRSFSCRLFAALFAPWFAVVVAEPVPMHDCPMHSVHPAVHSTAHGAGNAMRMDGMPAMDEHDVASTTGTSNDAPGESAPTSAHHGAHHQCCCLDCCSAGAAAPVGRAPELSWAPVAIRMAIPRAAAAVVAPAAADYALPFANGPPAARA